MKAQKILLPIIIAISALAFFSIFIVKEVNQAIVLQFGDPKKIILKPGLNFKIPFIQNVVFLDSRILNLDTPPEEVIAITSSGGVSRFKILLSRKTTFCIKGILKFKPGFKIIFFGSPNCNTIAWLTSLTINIEKNASALIAIIIGNKIFCAFIS